MKTNSIIFFGTSSFALPALKGLHEQGYPISLVVTQPDKPQKRGKMIIFSPIKSYALEHGLSIYQPASLKEKEALSFIAQKQTYVMIVVSYGQIIPQSLIDISPMGIVNIHGSLLPAYRGASPIAYALLNHEKKTGVTIMLIDEKMDHGPVLATKSLYITPDDNILTLTEKLSFLGADLLLKTLPKYLQKRISPIPQNHTKATYTKLLKKEDGRVNWDASAFDIAQHIKAFLLFPTSYTFFKQKRLIITQAHPIEHAHNQIAGTLTTYHKKLAVYCKEHVLIIDALQMEGKKEMSSNAFLQGYSIENESFH